MAEPQLQAISVNNTTLALYEWPGQGDAILLLHATGFHSRCWDQVVKALGNRHTYAVDLRFHGRSGNSGEPNWELMCHDVQQLVQQLDLNNLTAAGHSLGGHILARVAAWEQERFNKLVLIDPVITSPQRFAAIRELLAGRKPEDHPISRRKNQWQNAEQMYQRFADREPFASWQPTVLRDYCEHALKAQGEEGRLQLACDPLHEAALYANSVQGEGIYAELPGLEIPVTLLRAPPGDQHKPDFSASPTWPELATVLPDCTEYYLPHMNHFIPMQDPELVARHILAGQ